MGPAFLVMEIAHFCCIRPVWGQKCCDFTPGGALCLHASAVGQHTPPQAKSPPVPRAFVAARRPSDGLPPTVGGAFAQGHGLRPLASYLFSTGPAFLVVTAPEPIPHCTNGGVGPVEDHGAGDSRDVASRQRRALSRSPRTSRDASNRGPDARLLPPGHFRAGTDPALHDCGGGRVKDRGTGDSGRDLTQVQASKTQRRDVASHRRLGHAKVPAHLPSCKRG